MYNFGFKRFYMIRILEDDTLVPIFFQLKRDCKEYMFFKDKRQYEIVCYEPGDLEWVPK